MSYFLGNFCSSYVFGKLFKETDIRKHGSGNAGATNALRVFGVKIGVLAAVCDLLKGVIAVMIGKHFIGTDVGIYSAAIAVAVGHNWPVLLKFNGGKGIATSFGVIIAIKPTLAICIFIVFVLIVVTTKYVSLGSVLSACSLPLFSAVLFRPFDKNLVLFTSALAIMAIFRHSSNIKRLINGTESKLGQKAK